MSCPPTSTTTSSLLAEKINQIHGSSGWSHALFGMHKGRGFFPEDDPVQEYGLLGAGFEPFETLVRCVPLSRWKSFGFEVQPFGLVRRRLHAC
jgi:hypothetical protein